MAVEKQRKNKRVESCLVLRLDGGSSPPSSTTLSENQITEFQRAKNGDYLSKTFIASALMLSAISMYGFIAL